MEGNELHVEKLVRTDFDKLKHTSQTCVLDSGRTTDWQYSEPAVKLVSEMEWLLLPQE